MDEQEDQQKDGQSRIGTLVQLIVLAWSLGVISMSYFGNTVKQIDTTFAAGLLSGVLSSFNITVKKPGNNKKTEKTDPITGKKIDPVTGKLKS
jgi:hypothetical protein